MNWTKFPLVFFIAALAAIACAMTVGYFLGLHDAKLDGPPSSVCYRQGMNGTVLERAYNAKGQLIDQENEVAATNTLGDSLRAWEDALASSDTLGEP